MIAIEPRVLPRESHQYCLSGSFNVWSCGRLCHKPPASPTSFNHHGDAYKQETQLQSVGVNPPVSPVAMENGDGDVVKRPPPMTLKAPRTSANGTALPSVVDGNINLNLLTVTNGTQSAPYTTASSSTSKNYHADRKIAKCGAPRG